MGTQHRHDQSRVYTLECVLRCVEPAVHADDGSYAWHYQETPWETWDYDTGQQLMVLDLELDGRMRHVVTQASKNGFFYTLDVATGELLSGETEPAKG